MKLGILTTHPIQYQVPWFRILASIPEIDLTVFFCMLPDAKQQGEGFGVAFEWDVPLLDGYAYRVLHNVSPNPAVGSFKGCDTPQIAEIVRDEGFDAFIVNGWVVKSCLQLLWACNRYKVPCIVRGESNNLRPRAWWKKWLHRQLLSRYRACLFIGAGNRGFYRENGVPEDQLFFAPYCIDNEWFARAADVLRHERTAIRAAWGIPDEAVTFLFCGKFQAKKRPMDCLLAFNEVLSDRLDPELDFPIHLLMVGTGELLDECKTYARENALPVTFAGFLNQSEIPRAYVAADCLVLPSDHGETWGLVVNEGMACGLPALVSDQVGCHPDLIVPGETGDVFPMGDVGILAGQMRQIVDQREQLPCMAKKVVAKISTYNFQQVVEGVLAAARASCGPRPES